MTSRCLICKKFDPTDYHFQCPIFNMLQALMDREGLILFVSDCPEFEPEEEFVLTEQ